VVVYERQTQKTIRRFLDHRLSFPECIASLDSALADLIPRLEDGQLPRLRIVMMANNEIVMEEMARRRPSKETSKPLTKKIRL
jgi:hypothetical protein